jgi:hypothetical protein
MKTATPRVKKTVIIAVSTLLIFVALIILFISPLTKYLLEKHDVKLIGRELTMDWAYVNPFTGYVYLNDLRILEPEGDILFISADGVSGNFNLRQLFSKTIELKQLTIVHP